MKSEFINGRTVNTTESFTESFEILNEIFEDLGMKPINEKTARADFGIMGGETMALLDEMAKDCRSEMETEKAEAKQAWRYEI